MSRAGRTRPELAAVLLGFRGTFLTLGAFSFFINLLLLTPTVYMMQVYDRVLGSGNPVTLGVLSLMMLGLYALLTLLDLVRSLVLVRAAARLDLSLNERVFTAAFERNLQASGFNAGQALADLTSLRQFLTGAGPLALFDTPWLVIYLVLIFAFNALLGWFAVAGALVLVFLTWLTEALSHPPLREAQGLGQRSSNLATNHLRNAEVIDAMGMLGPVMRRWSRVHGEFLRMQALASDRAGWIGAATKFTRNAMQSLTLGLGALLVIENQITGGMMIAASLLVGRALSPVEQLIGSWRALISAQAAYRRLDSLLAENPPRLLRMSLPAPLGHVSVEGCSAGAPGAASPILRGVSFSVNAGDVVAIIGPSASGKSTLARVLVGVWPSAAGVVRLDGAAVTQWNREELGPYLGYLPQDIELFEGTVAENIARMGEMDSEAVVTAARRVGMHEAILRFPQGYDTPLGEGGSRLSGGQRQRIGLARALYGDPALVVLDEPNSNLDDVGEAALVAALQDLKAHGRTVLMVTHRLSAIGVVDKILVLGEGQIRLYGPRDQVLAILSGAAPAPQAAA